MIMSADDVKVSIERATRWLEEWGTIAPAKRSLYWLHLGVKNESGDFTQAFGGEARPAAESLPARFGVNGEASDRLVWFLRFTDALCLEAQTARSITGSADVPQFVDVVRAAMRDHLVERWTDQGGQPAELDPIVHQYRVVGVRLTEKGKERATELERGHARERPGSSGS
jgi:hypothetical protein